MERNSSQRAAHTNENTPETLKSFTDAKKKVVSFLESFLKSSIDI